ncbi:MAG: SGNH/GDSL hydrolase family protein [Methylococcales bacterium]
MKPFHHSQKSITKLAILLVITFTSTQVLAKHAPFERIVAFGDSISDTGNAFALLSKPENQACSGISQSVPPYAELDDFLIPGSPYAIGGHHFTNGATWLEGLAQAMALAGNVRPAFQNAGQKASNYAVGGARARTINAPCRVDLETQKQVYLNDFPVTSENTLVVIAMGGNDVRDAFAAAAIGEPGTAGLIIQTALQNIAGTFSDLYGRGARHFLIMNAPDIGKTPALRLIPGAPAGAAYLTQVFNDNLVLLIQGAHAQGIDVRLLDVHALVNAVVENPEPYGFNNATEACVTPNQPPFKCKKPDTYVFWDGIHPTKSLHEIIAKEAIAVMSYN